MEPIDVTLDRLVLIYKNVTLEEYERFIAKLESSRYLYPETPIKHGLSSALKSYRYNLNFGFGEGAIRLDYRHNTVHQTEEQADMRIEFNPSKLKKQNYEYERKGIEYVTVNGEIKIKEYDRGQNKLICEPGKEFFTILNTMFNKGDDKNLHHMTGEYRGHVRQIKELDVALDFEIPQEKFVIKSLTGKEHSHYKGTHYWGNKHTHGYLKMYDKKKERLKAKDLEYEKYESLTRLEYTMRFEKMIISEIARIKDFCIREDYKIAIINDGDLDKVDTTTKAYLLCYLNGLMEFKEMSRRYQEKTKKALDEMSTVEVDNILNKTFKEKILNSILNYIRL